MTAAAPNSTPAPEIPADWLELWESARWIHPDSEPAMRHAIAAGMDPRQLRLIQLADQEGEAAPMFWFGPELKGCRIFNPTGELPQ